MLGLKEGTKEAKGFTGASKRGKYDEMDTLLQDAPIAYSHPPPKPAPSNGSDGSSNGSSSNSKRKGKEEVEKGRQEMQERRSGSWKQTVR